MRIITYTVPLEDDGRQIKRIIRSRMMLSYHMLKTAKTNDALLVDGTPVHANYIVHTGQLISVMLEDKQPEQPIPPENLPIDIIYEDDDLLVINKPAPLPCQSSIRQLTGTLENRMAYRYPGATFRPVNRLDKGTSGLMLAAMNQHSQMLLSKQLHSDAFVREYLAITENAPTPERGIISAPIGKADGATVRREVRKDGKPATTHYELILMHGGLSLVKLRLETGRTHQIRVHLQSIGCPVAGDFLYGTERQDLPGRFALHSARVAFIHPMTGRSLNFEVPMPIDLNNMIYPSHFMR